MKSVNRKRRDEVMELIGRGCSNKEIAKQLRISERLVKWYVTRLYKENGFVGRGSRWKLVALALTTEKNGERR